MNYSTFSKMPALLQLGELSTKGVFLGYRVLGIYLVSLYQAYDFYVETFYHIEKHRIDEVISFENTDLLMPYLKKIKIDLTAPCRM